MLKKLLILCWMASSSYFALAQNDSIACCFEKIKAATEDSFKLKYAEEIGNFICQMPFGAYLSNQPVKYLKHQISAEAGIELFSWAVPLQAGEAFYNLFHLKERGKDYWIKSVPGEEFDWLFYDFIPFECKGKTYLLLLGWSKTRLTNKKAVFVARLEATGEISFAHSLLRKGEKRNASLTFEYALDGSMLLKQDKKGKRIIFDHLAPSDPKYEGYFMFYGPDASFDALLLKKGEWWYEENVKE